MMEYSDDNLMKLLSQASHQAGHGPKRGPEGHGEHGGYEGHGDGQWQGREGHGEHGGYEGHGGRGEHSDYGEGRKSDGSNGGRVGYPNCPGPGCGNNCPYKGTQDCPKVAARNAAGQGEDSEGHGDGQWQGKEGRGEHEGHGDGQWQGKEGRGEHEGHGDGRWQGKDGHGEHGGQGEGRGEHGDHGRHGSGKPYGHGPGGDDRDAAHSPMGRERILTVLNDEGSMSQNKLAERLDIRPQSVSELLGKLESDGYITRTQNDQDKRESLVSLSEEGKKRADEVKELQAKHTAEYLAPLSEDEKKTLFDLLVKLTGGKAEPTGKA